jgi:hypothetical protein
MPQNPRFPLVLVLKDHGPDFDLIPYLEQLEYEETGNEDISNATIHLNAHFGKFLKAVTQTGTAIPKIEFFDRIYIEFEDDQGDKQKDVVEVVHREPSELPGVGDTIELSCEHQGWHFFRMHNLKQYQRESNFNMIADMGAVYNSTDVRGTNQPSLEGHDVIFNAGTEIGNAASQATSIDMDFGNSEFLIGDGVNAVADRAGASVDAGGELEFFDWRTISKYDHSLGTNLDVIQMQYRVSGAVAVKPVISKSDAVAKILDTRSRQDPEKSTHVYAYGAINAGSLPTAFQIYFGEKEAFNAAPDWVDARVYKTNMRVQFNGAFYKSLQDHTAAIGVNDPTTGLGVFWTGPLAFTSIDYSPLTKNRPQYWINSGAGYVHQQVFPANNKAAMHDQNLVIRDINHRRTWADIKTTGATGIPSSMYIQGGSDVMYRGFRVFLDTENGVLPLLSPFTGNGGFDRFNKAYADAVVQHNGSTFTGADEWRNWDVFLTPSDDAEVIDMRNGDSYVWNPCSSLTFNGTCSGSRTSPGWNAGAYQAVSIGGLTVGQFLPGAIADCLHPYQILTGPNRPDFGNAQGIEPGTPGVNSAVRVKFNTGSGARSLGAWLNLAFPIPRDGYAGAFTATTVGERYLNPTLDLQNKHLSSIGKRGLNQGVDAEGRGSLDYGKLSAIRQYLKIIPTAVGGLVIAGGDFKIRIAFFDTDDIVVTKDVTITHRNNFDETEAEFPFETYRGRHGIAFTPLQELEILDIFNSRNVVRMSIATLESYDSEGRYNPLNRYGAQFGTIELQVDAPHFVKPLTAVTQEETLQASKPALNLERDPLEAPEISNYVQLKNHALSMLEIEQFKRVEYEITRPLRCDLHFGQEFTLKHPILIDDADVAPNDEIDLVCKRRVFNYKKGKGGGGFTVKDYGVKRFRT